MKRCNCYSFSKETGDSRILLLKTILFLVHFGCWNVQTRIWERRSPLTMVCGESNPWNMQPDRLLADGLFQIDLTNIHPCRKSWWKAETTWRRRTIRLYVKRRLYGKSRDYGAVCYQEDHTPPPVTSAYYQTLVVCHHPAIAYQHHQ